jgi:hypothetical protein
MTPEDAPNREPSLSPGTAMEPVDIESHDDMPEYYRELGAAD